MSKKTSKPKTTANRAVKTSAGGIRILVANGVNLDLLGRRETSIYGSLSLNEVEDRLIEASVGIAKDAGIADVSLEFFQTNREYELLEKLSNDYDGILINAGAWTHTSLALADRLRGLEIPYVEVHLSNISNREDFRKHSYLAASAAGVVYGLGPDSYLSGLAGLLRFLKASTLSS